MKPFRSRAALTARCTLPAALCLLAGCSSFRTEMGQPLSGKADGFAEGQTRVGDVLRELGPPDTASRLPDGFAFLYEHSVMSEFQLGFSVNAPVVRWFKFIKAWNHLDEETLLLVFDHQGVLRSAGTGKWKESLGGGSAAQFLLVVMSLSDITDFLRPADAHQWGEALLQPLPVTLNSAQDVGSGAHGLEQRLAPDYAGQRTLEMSVPKTEKEKRKIKKNYQMPQPETR